MDWNRMVRRLQHLYVMREYSPQNDWQPKPITLTAIRDDPESGTRTVKSYTNETKMTES